MRAFSYLLGVGLIALFSTVSLRADDKVVVHEWGTFTCLQDENGQAIGGINVDDEPVPHFVYDVATSTASQYSGDWRYGGENLGLPPYAAGKCRGIPGDPHVTMRLETPVIYIYPPKGDASHSVPPLDVRVDFHGGVLGEYYPHAAFSGLPLLKFQGQPEMDGRFPYVDKNGITAKMTTSLDWIGIRLGSTQKPIATDDKVWTTPREVSAPLLEVKFIDPDFKGVAQTYTQAEKFLFYRGVGHLDSPLCVKSSDDNANKLGICAKLTQATRNDPLVKIACDSEYPASWLVEIRPDGSCAYRAIGSFDERTRNKMLPFTSSVSKFEGPEFSADNLAGLKLSMQEELVREGLFPDEASAMLRTWELSYFKTPGLRFFYITPRAWVDEVLPLKITGVPTNITRVMVGRIELITDAQKAALARLAMGPCPDLAAIKKAAYDALDKGKLTDDEKKKFYGGERPLSELGITISPLVQDYLSLGRFRDALIVREQQQHPSAALAQFIKDNLLVPQPN